MNISNEGVRRALDAEDLEGLLKMGAPSDEYEQEARIIGERLRAIEGDMFEDAIAAVVSSVFAEQFGIVDPRVAAPHYARVARRILEDRDQKGGA